MSLLSRWLNLDRLDNLEDMSQLRELQNMQELEQLQELERLERLDHLEKLDKLDQLDQLHHLDKLDQNFQTLDQNLQILRQLEGIEQLHELQNLQQLARMNHLQQLDLLQRLERLEELGNLQNLQNLGHLQNLEKLDYIENLTDLIMLQELEHMGELEELRELEGMGGHLEQLGILDRVGGLDYITLLYVASVIVPGLVYQEAISLFSDGRLRLKRAIVLMAVYNVLNLFLCIQFVYSYVSRQLLEQSPIYYYLAWFMILVFLPFLLGWITALVFSRGPLEEFLIGPTHTSDRPPSSSHNTWENLLSDADTYQVTLTLSNEEKLAGIFKKGQHIPESLDPKDLYFTETAYYNPQTDEWRDLDEPKATWVKGTEIKRMEILPQS